jgi:uncharacterized coiled-coil protein SlyX
MSNLTEKDRMLLTNDLVDIQSKLITEQGVLISKQQIQINSLFKHLKDLEGVIDVQKEMLQML